MGSVHRATNQEGPSPRGRGARGGTLVEAAFSFPLLVALVLGIFDFGSALSDSIAVRTGAASSARVVAVGPWPAKACTLSAPDAGLTVEDMSILCMLKDRSDLSPARVRGRIVLAAGGYVEGQPIAVCSMTQLTSLTRLYARLIDDKAITTRSVVRIDAVKADGSLTTGGEGAFPGQDWAFCAAP